MHPIEDLDAGIGGEAGQCPFPSRIKLDPALRSLWIATPWAEVARRPGRSDATDEVDPGVRLIWQHGDDFARPDSFT
jgi:hypothetical protein